MVSGYLVESGLLGESGLVGRHELVQCGVSARVLYQPSIRLKIALWAAARVGQGRNYCPTARRHGGRGAAELHGD